MKLAPELLALWGGLALGGLPPGEVAEKMTLAGLFAGLLWFVLGQFRELSAQVRAQNDAILTVVRDNAAAMHSVADRLQDLEQRNRHDGR